MKKLITLLFLLLTFLGIEQSHAAKFSGLKSIQSGGTIRQYYLYVPDNLKENRPLMISCHGMNQDYQYQMQQTQWPLVADTANFVVVYPVGIAGSAWGQSYETGWDVEGMTDVNFMLDIINDAKANYHIDDTKVCISGFSLGGAFVYHCINKAADKFAVAAPISGYNPITTNTSCSRPVPIVHVHGTADGTMPYSKVKDYLKKWAQKYNCNMTPEETQGNGYTKLRYKDRDLNSEVVLYSVTGRDHVPSNDGFHTSCAIWYFFMKYPRDFYVAPSPEIVIEKKREFVVSRYGELNTSKGYVADASGKKVSLMGPSFNSSLHPLFWNKETVKYLVDQYNVQIIRLPVAIASGLTDFDICYRYHREVIQALVDEMVEAAIENDIYVIIDFQEHHAEDWIYWAKDFFGYFAKKWGNYPNVLYEIYNEPVCDKGTVINYAKQVIPTIRAIDSDNIIIVGSPNYSREPHTVTDAGQGQSNIAYSWHGYVMYNHQSDWDSSEASSWNTSVPVIVTEWGVGNNKDDGGLLNLFKERGVINCFWSMSNLGGDEATWSVLKESCNKKSDWTEADMTENGAFMLAQTKGWVDFAPVSLVDEPEDSPEVYTEFDEATGTLTYYYDDKKASRTGVTEVYDPVNNPDAVRFTGYYKKVTKAVIDPSMKDANLTSMRSMFCGGYNSETSDLQFLINMTSIEGLENLNTAIVTDMNSMFSGCELLTSLDLSSFNTSNVTNMNGMFLSCTGLQIVDVSSFDISNVTDMRMMFGSCWELTTICCDKDWSNTSADSYVMFSGCKKLVGGNGTAFDSNVIDATYARPDGGTESPGYFTAGVVGDVNGDKVVNFTDAQSILTLMANESYESSADVNNDDAVNFTDYQSILTIMAQ